MFNKIREFFRSMIKSMWKPVPERGLIALPIDMKPNRKAYEELGFEFYKWRYPGACLYSSKVKTDRVMCLARLPEGWKEGKWIGGYRYYLVDENGKNRIEVFAKNELLSRKGKMSFVKYE